MARSKNTQRTGFEDRLNRINKGGANTMGEVHIGPRDEDRARKGKADNTVRMKKKKKAKSAAHLTDGSTAVLAPIGVLLGGMSMFVGQATQYQFFDAGGLLQMTPPAALEAFLPFLPFLIGGLLALAFAWTFRLTTMVRFAAVVGGFVATFVYQADLIQTMPGMYANFFSKEFVETALANV